MYAPLLYKIRKLPCGVIVENDFDLNLNGKEMFDYLIAQQDNMLFRQIRRITGDTDKYNQYVVFVDCKGMTNQPEVVEEIVKRGFSINGQEFVLSERSASMTRNAILSFIDVNIADDIDEIVSLGYEIKKTVIPKYMAYRGLMFSSCHCIEDWKPKIIIVDDCDVTLPNQHIKYLADDPVEYEDKETGEKKTFINKKVVEGYKDLSITFNDGCGIIHPKLAEYLTEYLHAKYPITSFIMRCPYLKGWVVNIDYTEFYKERGVDFIQDIWGRWHDVNEPMIICTKSMYKGFKYFKIDGTAYDWDRYWERFDKYHHCFGVAKWNFDFDEEPVYTRINYQVLQTNRLPFDEFVMIAKTSVDWVEKIVHNDPIATMIFLGILDKGDVMVEEKADYMSAIRKNYRILNEPCVKQYLKNLLKKYIDEFKCGKLWVKGCFKFLAPDMIAVMEYIGGLEPKGFLKSGQMWSARKENEKDYLIERNPHICSSEDCVLSNVENDVTKKYFGHIANVVMINRYDNIMAQLNGAD